MVIRKYLFFLLIFLSFSLSCSTTSSGSFKNVNISRDGKNIAEVKVELAQEPAERMKGLMFRQEMPADQGMWFIFDKDTTSPFWMENTYISLDIIFVDNQNRIVSIAKDTEPFSRKQIVPKGPYRYVLEVNAGFANSHNLQKGDIIKLN